MTRISPRSAAQIGINLTIAALGVITLILFLHAGQHATAAPTTPISTIGIDMDTSGNGPRAEVGATTANDTCARVNSGQTRTIDVFEDQVAPDRGISGFQFTLNYDASKIHITGVDYNQLLDQANSSLVVPFGDTSSSDGAAGLSAVDFGKGIEPGGASEAGPGVLVRLTIQGQQGSGNSSLTLSNVIVTDDAGNVINVSAVLTAKVATNTDCAGAATPTPTPTTIASPPPGPTQAPSPAGDLDCSGTVNPGDVNLLLKYVGGVPAPTGCSGIGSVSGSSIKGDINCDNRVDPLDVLRLLLDVAAGDSSDCAS